MKDLITLPVQHVSHTAWLVAAFRAQETERTDAHFKDLLAKKLLGNLEQEYLGGFSEDVRKDHWLLTVRTCQIDQLILKAIESGVDTVLNLGAGLDTRPYRLQFPKDVSWFEADFPELIAYKNEKLKDETPQCHLTRIAADLGNSEERRRVLDWVNSRAELRSKSMLVLTEGLLGYLSQENVTELAEDLAVLTTCKFWVMDMFNQSFRKISERFWQRSSTDVKASVQLGFIPEDTVSFLRPLGWEVKEFQSFGQGALSLNRLPRGVDAEEILKLKGFMESGVGLFTSKKNTVV